MGFVRFVGDIHGDLEYFRAAAAYEQAGVPDLTISVGDVGVGFVPDHVVEHTFGANHLFIRGNHDNPETCKQMLGYIPDGSTLGDMMFIGGAYSIDKAFRTPGSDWWPEEELNIEELAVLGDLYRDTKPRFMVTHTCPHHVGTALLRAHGRERYQGTDSRTEMEFQHWWEEYHQPEIWVFGHWHLEFVQKIGKTTFVCLPINSTIDLFPTVDQADLDCISASDYSFSDPLQQSRLSSSPSPQKAITGDPEDTQ